MSAVAVSVSEKPTVDDTPVFTRFLYVVNDVYFSLLWGLVSPDDVSMDEVLFWAMELYFSGFKRDLVVYLEKLYLHFFEPRYSKKFSKFDAHIQRLLLKENVSPEDVATVVTNLWRRHSSEKNPMSAKLRNIFIIYSSEDIKTYYTRIVEEVGSGSGSAAMRPYNMLISQCKYFTLKTNLVDKTCETPRTVYSRATLKTMFREEWLYWSYFTPLWRTRIQQYKGCQNHLQHTVEFMDHDQEETFYQYYGYDPDELPLDVFSRCIGEEEDVMEEKTETGEECT